MFEFWLIHLFWQELARCDGAGKLVEELKSFPVPTPPGKRGQQQSGRACTELELVLVGNHSKTVQS